MEFLNNNKKLISYLGCGILIVAVIYFILTVLKISGDTFKLNMIEGFGGDDDEKESPQLKKKKKAFEKAADNFFGDGESKGKIDMVINKRKKRLEELEFILEDDKEEIIEKINKLLDINMKIEQNETLLGFVKTKRHRELAKTYGILSVSSGVLEKYGDKVEVKKKGFF